ncbi:hypothetical protein NW768_008600 [Fusarium equiseti]|uniref:F-box domain-containing protein n=1 Tax=Fusarium equiseti TaxID=61235 RepID=A0ABQ8R4J7_FUSEQ|nr:hypothetical protein NW768_008600 [Fusarium equiseti]
MSLTLGEKPNELHLPTEVWYRICSLVPQSDLVSLRLVCSKLGKIALPECYKTIYIEIHRESSPRRLCEIAKSRKLLHHVRELILYDDADYSTGFKNEHSRQSFLNTVPMIRFFNRLISLRIRFRTYSRLYRRNHNSWLAMQHRLDLLDTIFHWIVGMGNKNDQDVTNSDAGFYGLPEGQSSISDLTDFSQPAIPLQQLIITNLPDHHEAKRVTSEAFLKILSMPSLSDLRLHVEARRDLHHPVRAPEGTSPASPGKYLFFDKLPVSWLAPEMTKHLQVLTLHCKDYWGWCPKMDLRLIELPRLKALSLGRYIFSHQWQIDWFASIGKQNGSGGLEELYLHECPILYEATHYGPFDTVDSGYPTLKSILGLGRRGTRENQKYPIRWNDIFSQWTKSLDNLKVFHMGQSTYQDVLQDTFTRTQKDQNFLQELFAKKHRDTQEESMRHRVWYDLQEKLASPCPSGPITGPYLKHKTSLKGQLASIEFNQYRDFQMKYIKYNIERERDNANWPWVHPEHPWEGWAPEEGTVMTDDAAYEIFMDAVDSRAASEDMLELR